MREPPRTDLLTDRRALFDAAVPPVVFVATNALAGLPAAVVAATATAAVAALLRLARRQPVRHAVSGLLGVGIGALIALWLGRPEAYFGPGTALNALYGALALLTILLRRPLVGLVARWVQHHPAEWYRHRLVRRAFSEATLAWAVLFAGRAGARWVLITRGEVEWLAVVSIGTGLPAFVGLLAATYAYLPWRLRRLGAPAPEGFGDLGGPGGPGSDVGPLSSS